MKGRRVHSLAFSVCGFVGSFLNPLLSPRHRRPPPSRIPTFIRLTFSQKLLLFSDATFAILSFSSKATSSFASPFALFSTTRGIAYNYEHVTSLISCPDSTWRLDQPISSHVVPAIGKRDSRLFAPTTLTASCGSFWTTFFPEFE